jgi:hypothetical protein
VKTEVQNSSAWLIRKTYMTLCPIAVVAGCNKCPAFKICPMTKILGDVPKDAPAKSADKKK